MNMVVFLAMLGLGVFTMVVGFNDRAFERYGRLSVDSTMAGNPTPGQLHHTGDTAITSQRIRRFVYKVAGVFLVIVAVSGLIASVTRPGEPAFPVSDPSAPGTSWSVLETVAVFATVIAVFSALTWMRGAILAEHNATRSIRMITITAALIAAVLWATVAIAS